MIGIDGQAGDYYRQRIMPDGTIAEVIPLTFGRARLCVGRYWGGGIYEASY